MNLRLTIAGLSACGAFGVSPAALAAIQAPCVPAAMTPRAAAIPVNLPGFGYTALKATATDVHLLAGPSRAEVPVTVGPVVDGLLKVVPTSPLTVGGSYQLEFTSFCDYGPIPKPQPIAFTVTAQAPLPTKIGDLQGAPTVTLKDFGTTQYTLAATYALADEMKPWAAVYELGIELDGKTIETRATLAAASVQISAIGWCDGAAAATNNHKVRLRARLPFAPIVDTALADMDFVCPAVAIRTPPPGNPTPPNGPGNPSSGGTTTTTKNSGGCAVAGHASSPSSLLAGLTVGLCALLRRRKRAA